MQKWYIIQTKPRWEKKVAIDLIQRGIECFFPVKKVQRKWSDRIKTLEEPLFRTCVFVKISHEQKTEVRVLDGVVNFVYDNGKPAQVKGKEINTMRNFLPEAVPGLLEDRRRIQRQQEAIDTYIKRFDTWLTGCMERPKTYFVQQNN